MFSIKSCVADVVATLVKRFTSRRPLYREVIIYRRVLAHARLKTVSSRGFRGSVFESADVSPDAVTRQTFGSSRPLRSCCCCSSPNARLNLFSSRLQSNTMQLCTFCVARVFIWYTGANNYFKCYIFCCCVWMFFILTLERGIVCKYMLKWFRTGCFFSFLKT